MDLKKFTNLLRDTSYTVLSKECLEIEVLFFRKRSITEEGVLQNNISIANTIERKNYGTTSRPALSSTTTRDRRAMTALVLMTNLQVSLTFVVPRMMVATTVRSTAPSSPL